MNYRLKTAVATGVIAFLSGLLWVVDLAADQIRGGDPVGAVPLLGGMTAENVWAYLMGARLLGFLLTPVLVVLVGYLVGRRLDLRARYRGLVGALVAGSVVGYGLGRTLAVVYLDSLVEGGIGVAPYLALVLPGLVTATVSITIAGFAGAAAASVIRGGIDGADSTDATLVPGEEAPVSR